MGTSNVCLTIVQYEDNGRWRLVSHKQTQKLQQEETNNQNYDGTNENLAQGTQHDKLTSTSTCGNVSNTQDGVNESAPHKLFAHLL